MQPETQILSQESLIPINQIHEYAPFPTRDTYTLFDSDTVIFFLNGEFEDERDTEYVLPPQPIPQKVRKILSEMMPYARIKATLLLRRKQFRLWEISLMHD